MPIIGLPLFVLVIIVLHIILIKSIGITGHSTPPGMAGKPRPTENYRAGGVENDIS
jgi:hypothetical protein